MTDVVALCKSFTYQSCHHRQYLGIAEDVTDTVRDGSVVEWNSTNKRSVDGSSLVPTTLHIKMNWSEEEMEFYVQLCMKP